MKIDTSVSKAIYKHKQAAIGRQASCNSRCTVSSLATKHKTVSERISETAWC